MKRYIFKNPFSSILDIRVIESSSNYSELPAQIGYQLVSITKIGCNS